LIGNAFKNIAALSLESGYKIKQLDNVGTGPAPAAKEAPKEAGKEKDAKDAKKPAEKAKK